MVESDFDYFVKYNYDLLTNCDYKEDSVREELISPLIKLLGYKVGTDNNILRSKSLIHPYLTTGSTQRKITYIPDYLLLSKSKNILVLDAKSPNENITSGKNVEQAYSYAIHPEIRTNIFALCNGFQFSLFSLNKIEPILVFTLQELPTYWNVLARILHPDILAGPEITKFYPDFGIYISTFSENCKMHFFMEVHSKSIGKIDNDTYTCNTVHDIDNSLFAQSIDFNKNYLNDILMGCDEAYKNKILYCLEHAPFQFFGEENDPDIVFGVQTELSQTVINNPEESFRPFIVNRVINSEKKS